MDRKQVRRYTVIVTSAMTLILTCVGLASTTWAKVSEKGTIRENEGIFHRCTSACVFIPNPTKWRTFTWYLTLTFVILIFINALGQALGLVFEFFVQSEFYGVCYSLTALIGFIILILYPTHVRPLGKEELIHVWLGWGYYVFFTAVCCMISLSVQCLEVSGTAAYPSLGVELQF